MTRALVLVSPHRGSAASERWHSEVIDACQDRGWRVTCITNHLGQALHLAETGMTDAVVALTWEIPKYARRTLAGAGVLLVELRGGTS